LGERREFFERQAADDELGRLRVEDEFKADLLELREHFGRLLRQPDLNLRLSVADELRLVCRGRAVLLQTLDDGQERRVKFRLQLLPLLLLRVGFVLLHACSAAHIAVASYSAARPASSRVAAASPHVAPAPGPVARTL